MKVSGRYHQPIKDVVVHSTDWSEKHWKTIVHNYAQAPYFEAYRAQFERLYLELDEQHLSSINYRFLTAICDILGIKTKISWSMDYELVEGT